MISHGGHKSKVEHDRDTILKQFEEIQKKQNYDVNVHIMDKDNKNTLRRFRCQKEVIFEGMLYFQKFLKDASMFNSIDIQVQCDPKIFQILYKFAELQHQKSNLIDSWIFEVLTTFNFFQTLISADYLIMKKLRFKCNQFFKNNIELIINETFGLKVESQDQIDMIPIDQLEDYQIVNLAKVIAESQESIATLIRVEYLIIEKWNSIDDVEFELLNPYTLQMRENLLTFLTDLMSHLTDLLAKEMSIIHYPNESTAKLKRAEQMSNTFQICTYCNKVLPSSVFQLSNSGFGAMTDRQLQLAVQSHRLDGLAGSDGRKMET